MSSAVLSSEVNKDKPFDWDPESVTDVKIDDEVYYHPYPTRKNGSNVWKFFRCKRGINYASEQPVFCLRCCQKMKAKAGQQPKFLLYSLNWKQGYTTSHLITHISSKHKSDLERIEHLKVSGAHRAEINESGMSRLFHGQRTISNENQKDLTRDLVRHMIFEDKEPYSIVERPGFRKFVNTNFDHGNSLFP